MLMSLTVFFVACFLPLANNRARAYEPTDLQNPDDIGAMFIICGVIIGAAAVIGLPIVYFTGGIPGTARYEEARVERETKKELARMESATMVCPRCGLPLMAAATSCPSCGWDLNLSKPAGEPRTAVIRTDVTVGGQLAFAGGEIVQVDSPNPGLDRPGYQYPVYSNRLGRKVMLRNDELML